MDEVPMIYGTAVIGYCVYQVSESMSARGIGACNRAGKKNHFTTLRSLLKSPTQQIAKIYKIC